METMWDAVVERNRLISTTWTFSKWMDISAHGWFNFPSFCTMFVPCTMKHVSHVSTDPADKEWRKGKVGVDWDTPSYSASASRERATDKLLNLWQLADKCRRKVWGHSCSNKCSTGVSNSHRLTGCMYCTPFSCGLHCVLFNNGAKNCPKVSAT